jgi:hypothetical protein
MISDKKTLFMKSKESTPYEFQWLNETIFQQTLDSLISTSTITIDKKIATIGYIVENNLNDMEAILKYDNSLLKIDLSRISKTYKISKDPYYLYGVLKKKNDEVIFTVNYHRYLSSEFDFDAYKEAILFQRKVVIECDNMK